MNWRDMMSGTVKWIDYRLPIFTFMNHELTSGSTTVCPSSPS
jgi:hypothetical protein